MAYYAKLQDNIVQQIIVVSDTIDDGATWCTETFGGEWVQTLDDGSTRFAEIGDTYDYETQTFIAPPQPEPIEPIEPFVPIEPIDEP
jgi:hypothetical protein